MVLHDSFTTLVGTRLSLLLIVALQMWQEPLLLQADGLVLYRPRLQTYAAF
jgi:hypothetical protein